jgi:hypothetical protein
MNLDDVALSIPTAAETATTLSSSANPAVSGQPVAFTATVISGDAHSVPTGTAQLAVDGTPVGGPVVLDSGGRATWSSSTLEVGAHTITVSYQPAPRSGFQSGHTEPLTQTVNKASTVTTIAVAPDPSVGGQDAVFTATVATIAPGAGTPTGTVQFREADGTPIGAPRTLSGGHASFAAPTGAGTYTVSADYGGEPNFGASSGHVSRTVRRADTVTTLSASRNPVSPGGQVTFSVVVSIVAPGHVAPIGTIAIEIDDAISPPIALCYHGPTDSAVDVTFQAPMRSVRRRLR